MKFSHLLIALATVSLLLAQAPAEEPVTASGSPDAAALGWRLGIQAWTLREYTFLEALEKIESLGLHYVEMFPGQRVGGDTDAKTGPGMAPEVVAMIQEALKARNIRLVSYGVTGLPGDETRCREIFDWARRMGIETICSEPSQNALPMIDKLAQEYGVNVAIHNHPTPSRYWNPDTALKAFEGLSRRIGVCGDTGHWSRSGLDPLECLRKLEGRIVTLHFKDLNRKGRAAHDVPWGTGVCDAPAMMTELRRQGFRGVVSVEYEHNWKGSLPEIAQCVAFFNAQARRLSTTPPEGWRSLFDGTDLSQWECRPNGWHVADGAIAWKRGCGFLWSRERFGNFVLELEFKVNKGTNSGVFVRTGSRGNWLHSGIEVQVLDSHGRAQPSRHDCGAIYDCLAPRVNAARPAGEWNQLAVICRDNLLQVELNGQRIIDMDLNHWTEAHKNPDGSGNKFNTAYKDMPREGFIGLQDHGNPVWYRNMRIRVLPGSAPQAPPEG
jgi:sugar phosphate isomerase/epimerase